MHNDIVTRLRDLREVLMGNPIMAREVQEAMDEIERLRAELVLWKHTSKHVRYHHCKPVGCRYCAIYAEEYPNDPVVE